MAVKMPSIRGRPSAKSNNANQSSGKPSHGKTSKKVTGNKSAAGRRAAVQAKPGKQDPTAPKKQLDFMNGDSESGYDEAPLDGDEDDADAADFSTALAGPSKPRGASAPPARRPQRSQEDMYGNREKGGETSDVDAEEEEIMAMMGKKSIKDGTAAVKASVGKGKAKETKAVVGGGSWQSMGLSAPLLRSLLMRGYKTPTPIQRASIPSAIASPPRDLVGMARTGSGKTLAYMIPLLQRLSGRHSTKFGARALIMCPGRELAMQILRVGKEMGRGFRSGKTGHAGDNESADEDDGADAARKGGDLRWGLVVGGEGLDEQFSMIASNPDVIIATPGRLLHLVVEMNLDLRSVEYVVFDEADRLFEMGFEIQLREILHRLPASRQSMLFSATLPKTLVEFARAGLVNPKLIRLDAESKISSDLRMAFFSVKPAEKEAALLTILKEVIKVPTRHDASRIESDGDDDDDEDGTGGKAKGRAVKRFKRPPKHTAPHQALIFCATKHHVEYLTTLLQTAGYSTSHIYGSLDQSARKQQMDRFRRGRTDLLVVTDVAARGIDIPVLENVINYDFPSGARVFVHRVGRTARAGRKGWAYSLVTNPELPYLLDLHLFLGRPLVSAKINSDPDNTEQMLIGCLPRDSVDAATEYISTTLTEAAPNLNILKGVTKKGQAMYERSQGKASQESYRRAKGMTKDASWGLAGSSLEAGAVHPVFAATADPKAAYSGMAPLMEDNAEMAEARANLLAQVNAFQPLETVFEVGARGKTAGAELMKVRRKTVADYNFKKQVNEKRADEEMFDGLVPNRKENDEGVEVDMFEEADAPRAEPMSDLEMADEDDLGDVFEMPKPKKAASDNYRDESFYMSHYQSGAAADRGYSLRDGQSFVEQARNVTLDLNGDDGIVARATRPSQLNWDKKQKKFIQGDGVGSDNKKLIRTESGARLPASFKSGRFEEWKTKRKIRLPRVGEAEGDAGSRAGYTGDKKYRHSKVVEAKPLDPRSTTYEKKVYALKKKAEKLGESEDPSKGKNGSRGTSGARSELRSMEDIRKKRQILEQRRQKNARPSKKGGKGKGKGKR